MSDLISRQAAIDAVKEYFKFSPLEGRQCAKAIERVPSAQLEVVPHKNYRYLSDYWCECGCHLGKQHDVKYCPDCGKKVNWDE